ncbi:MAG: DUF2141 domain-containing protein [Flavobacteriaceae bacterium]
MRTSFFTLLLFIIFISGGVSQEKDTLSVTLDISITKFNKGSILIALYESEESYMKESYKSADVLVKNNKAKFIFHSIKKGVYAFSLFHDLNNNKKLDTNFLGIPKEPYGFSNNKKGRFGPPKFNEASLEINKNSYYKISIE